MEGGAVGHIIERGPPKVYVDRNSKMTTTAGHSFYIKNSGYHTKIQYKYSVRKYIIYLHEF
jgi:hypothetical protein